MERDFITNDQLGKTIAKKFVAVKLDTAKDGMPRELRNIKVVGLPTFAFVSSSIEEISIEPGYKSQAQFGALVDGLSQVPELTKILEKTDKSKPAAIQAALKKYAAFNSNKSEAVLNQYATDSDMPDSIRKFAIENLAKQPRGPQRLMALIAHPNAGIKASARTAMISQGNKAIPVVVKGLEDSDADQRLGSFAVLSKLVNNPKLVRDANFWKNGKDDQRSKAVEELRTQLNIPKKGDS